MRYEVRNRDGRLSVPTYAELRLLYKRSFISDDDEVRAEGSDRWVRAGDMPDLRPLKPIAWFHGFEFVWLMAAIAVGSLILALLMK